MEVRHPALRVFVNGVVEPALVVHQLGTQRQGRVGLWGGNPSDGDCAALRVTPDPR